MLPRPIDSKHTTVILSIGLFYLFALPLILLNVNHGRAFDDQQLFHLPTIEHFTQHLDFHDYPSATTPGYHLILALVGKLFSTNEMLLKLVSSLFTAGLVGVIAAMLHNRYGRFKTLLLVLPFIVSIYILPSGVWLLPDNLAWLCVVGVLMLVTKSTLTNLHFILLSLLLVLAMLVRQPYLWLASAVWAYALAYHLLQAPSLNDSFQVMLKAMVCAIPAFALFYGFYVLWGGLVPPSFQNGHQGISGSTPAFFLSVLSFYSLFFSPLLYGAMRQVAAGRNITWIAIGCVIGLIFAILPDTYYSKELGRYSGLWNLAQLAPTIGNKSLFIIAFSTIGGGMAVTLALLLPTRVRLILSLATVAFVLSLMPNKFVFERYMSGYIFICLYFVFYYVNVPKHAETSRLKWAGPILFSAFNGLILLRAMVS